jgi:quinoprotein glucose dehydrogenase
MRRLSAGPGGQALRCIAALSLTAVSLSAFAACTDSPPAATDADPLVLSLPPEEAARLASEANANNTGVVTPGFELSLWAPEALVADPIGFSIDDLGRVVYTRTNRSNRAEFDIRGHRDWMIESITFRTVEDRRAFLHRELAPERSDENEWLEDYNGDGSRDWRDLTVHQEHVYRIEDTSGDGIADVANLLIADFDDEHTDVANGVLAFGDDLYLGLAPDLWRLRDTNGDGRMDSRESLSHGYGVHIGFGGHGMSGVTVGPDGRIYWGIGDIGFNVTDRAGRQWAYPNQGAILRAEPDGSGFEVFAAGVRNTHEFVFDELGNLISVDNDGDHSGERERLVYIVNGSDSGWRINWQFGKYDDPVNNGYKVWMDERLFLPRFEEQAAYILPPIASYHAGPAGMVYNPGTALSPEWRNHFFVSSFTGSTASTRINAFTLEQSGAGFRLARDTVVLRGILTTGMDFGPDGALYLADWVDGWAPNGRGRIWKYDTPAEAGSTIREETRQLLAADFDARSEADLLQLLRHADMRVRTKAQFALAEREAAGSFLEAAEQRDHRLARVHGLWGLGQLSRRNAAHAAQLLPFLNDADAEVRAQAAKLLGDVRYAPAAPALVPLLAHESPRVRFFAAEALGRIGHAPAVEALVQMLAANDDEDVYLRHAGSIALARIGESEPIARLSTHPSRAVRIAAVVALRRMKDPAVARFLQDQDSYIVTEAARAINDDESIEAALPDLARLLDQERFADEALVRRAISANLRVGTPEAAARLASYAARDAAPEAMRVDALLALSVLPQPSVLDRVDGSPRGVVERDPAIARTALDPEFASLIASPAAPIRIASAQAAGRLAMPSTTSRLLERLQEDPSPEVRTSALQALSDIRSEPLEPIVRTALSDPDADVRMAALGLVPDLDLADDVTTDLLTSVIGPGTVQEQQAAIASLGNLRTRSAEAALGGLLDRLASGQLLADVQLELYEAVDSAASPALEARAEQIRSTRSGSSPLMSFEDALHGGDGARGQQVVMRNESAQCTRCHAFADQGPDVGPDLRGIGGRLTREQLLEALVDPSARVPPGYGSTSLTLNTGEVVSGTLREETEDFLAIQMASDLRRVVPRTDIASRADSPSAMPQMQNLLTRRQLRDVVEYLSTLR